ncbi:MAG TPA: transcription termination/antitermination protein NusG [bacterium]|nr:transcription termination/antitermination protein NusG [bacterium]
MAWYIAHTKSGFESKVKKAIESQTRLKKLTGKIFRVLVPEEEKLEMVRNQKRPVKHKVYPGYVFIEMELTNETQSLIRDIDGVTHFVGQSGKEPLPVKPEEMATILKRLGETTAAPQIDLEVGDNVKVLMGPFADFDGTIQDIDLEKGKAKVLLSVFGRETPVEFEFTQIEKVEKG